MLKLVDNPPVQTQTTQYLTHFNVSCKCGLVFVGTRENCLALPYTGSFGLVSSDCTEMYPVQSRYTVLKISVKLRK